MVVGMALLSWWCAGGFLPLIVAKNPQFCWLLYSLPIKSDRRKLLYGLRSTASKARICSEKQDWALPKKLLGWLCCLGFANGCALELHKIRLFLENILNFEFIKVYKRLFLRHGKKKYRQGGLSSN
ncbi:hypothetical protein LPBF_07735 [Flavobacterium crassostreae]|uniref:Uncharacterized protein n=1 Tax=Flavobacterium crassostreae TaxID=1763534 RepID=A0A1B9E0R5_9FLAO|nr:hypothetical protein LPBF_07735 [Flavobacterium crassostreae]